MSLPQMPTYTNPIAPKIELRDYQQAAKNATYCYLESNQSCIVEAPCGAGKSLIIASICLDAIETGAKVLVLTHRQKLLEQNEAELKNLLPTASTGFYSAGIGQKTQDNHVIFGGIQSIANAKLAVYQLLIIDECHLVAPSEAGQYKQVIAQLLELNPNLKIIGLTATPYRLDCGYIFGKEDSIFSGVSYTISVKTLLDKGYLCPIRASGGGVAVDVSKVKHKGGEFLESELADVFIEKTVPIVKDIIKHGRNKRAWLLFCVNIKHAEAVTKELKNQGIDAACYHSEIDNYTGRIILDKFANGALKCLVNVNILTTGSNFPIADLCGLIRATESTALYVQIVGRVMRNYPNKKEALLLDYGGNVLRHGCIDNVIIKEKGTGTGEAPAKQCPSCSEFIHAAVMVCPTCGHEFERTPDKALSLKAFDGAVLQSQVKPLILDVDNIDFKIHKKIGKPDSIRVDYKCGLATYSEWLTPEHSEVGLRKCLNFYFRNVGTHYNDIETSQYICESLRLNKITSKIKRIEVKQDGKYFTIVKRYTK